MAKETPVGDLAKKQEICIAVMNLISVEEHLAFTAGKTGKKDYIDVYNSVRAMRSRYMREIVKNKEGEMWCVAKHLLSTVMRLLETGVKYGAEGKKREAIKFFEDAIKTYKLFWTIQVLGDDKAGKKHEKKK